MLTEIAFTPAVFDEEAQEDKSDWRDQLKEIRRVLAPLTGVSPVIVSNLHGSTWYWEAERALRAVEDHKLKRVCQDIILKMKECLVTRPACGDYPVDDVGWCREALASHAAEPIERIVATRETKAALDGRSSDVYSLDALESAGFWYDVSDHASPDAFFEDQVVLLRKLFIHADWLAFCSPYANTTEMDFTIELLKAAVARPAAFGKVEIEIHFDNWDRGSSSAGPESERNTKQDQAAQFVASKLTGALPTPSGMNFFCWEKMLERTLIAGSFTTDGNGVRRRRPRWGLSMTHVARTRRPRVTSGAATTAANVNAEPHRWRLLDQQELAAPFDRFLDDVAATRPTPSSV